MHSFILCAGMLAVLHSPPSEVHTTFPYKENFDSSIPPELPADWSSSRNRSSATNDFTTTTSSARSSPNALISTNATIGQFLVSPAFDFRGTVPDSIIFWTRRSSSHLAAVILEVSLNDGSTFPLTIGDTLANPGHSDYTRSVIQLPETLETASAVRFRWTILGASSGSTGTFRLDDIEITVRTQMDLALGRISVDPAIPGPGDHLFVTAHILNPGLQSVKGFKVDLYLDRNADSAAVSEELIASADGGEPLVPGDSVGIDFNLPALGTGSHVVIGTVFSDSDGNSSNDTLRTLLSIRHPDQTIVINEIMFDPPVGIGEYIELFNPGSDSINLNGWLIRDKPGGDGTANEYAFSGLPSCPPGGFVVLAEDSTVIQHYSIQSAGDLLIVLTGGSPGLNNDGDDLVLLDFAGGVIDSISYLPSWHHPDVTDPKGISLEKISPLLQGNDSRSWSTSADYEGGTPGKQNSLYTSTPPRGSSISMSPNPFSPDGDGRDDVVIISYEGVVGSSTFSLRIFDIDGRLIRQLATNEITGPSGNIVWDGLDDQERKARIGMYVVFLEVMGETGEVVAIRKGVVVLAGRL